MQSTDFALYVTFVDVTTSWLYMHVLLLTSDGPALTRVSGWLGGWVAGCPLFPRSRSVGEDQLPTDSEEGLGFFKKLPVKYYFLKRPQLVAPLSYYTL